jgi:UDP-N-acetylglucosamine 2-epimerase (non-hydrolysing)
MKAAPVVFAAGARPGLSQLLVHTGQHYDERMSDVFFRQLGMPKPDVNLEVGSGSHAVQTAEVMTRFEPVLLAHKPDWLVVYGDVNSTVACALVAAKLGVRIAHVEAGLRSWDRAMPEEINRLVTDQISDLLFPPSEDGVANLLREGVDRARIHMVGNCMIDTLVRLLPKALAPDPQVVSARYLLVTLHRPSNVDDSARLAACVAMLNDLSESIQVVFPIHPRTRKRVADQGLRLREGRNLVLMEPQGYLEFLGLQHSATLILTDSGGVQEEATYLGVPCLTMRENTERPVTCTLGTNRLVGQDVSVARAEALRLLAGDIPKGGIPPLWDGRAGERIADVFQAMVG